MNIHSGDKLWTSNYILLALGNLFMATGFYFLLPTLPVYVVDVLGARKQDVGLILAAYTVSALIIRPFTGIALDIWGRKWIYLVSFLLFTLMIAAYPLMTTFAMLMVLRFLHGFAWGVNTTSGSTTVVDIIPAAKRGRGIGYFGMSYTISMAIGPMLAFMVLAAGGYTSMFMAASVIAFAGLILVLFVRYPTYKLHTGPVRLSWNRFIEKTSLPMAIPQVLFGMTYGGVVAFITLYAKQLNIRETGTFFLVIALGIFISRMFAGRIFDNRGPFLLMVSGFSISLVGYLVLALDRNLPGFLVAAFLIGIGSGVLMPTLNTMVNNVVPMQRRGAANATITTAFDLGIGGGSLLLGIVAEAAGFPLMYGICAMLSLAALLVYIVYVNRFYHTHKLALTAGTGLAAPR
jgi:MFS family permease